MMILSHRDRKNTSQEMTCFRITTLRFFRSFIEFCQQKFPFSQKTNPVYPYFYMPKMVSMEKVFWPLILQKNHRSDFELDQCLFWNKWNLGHLFAYTSTEIKFIYWFCSQNLPNTKKNHTLFKSVFAWETP